MSLLDWVIVGVASASIFWIGWITQRYLKGVSSFLAGGRVAGRYVLCVAGAEAGLGLVSVVAIFEMQFRSGVALNFWHAVGIPVNLLLTLTGFVVYRFRQTRAMTLAQFLEARYSRNFRFFVGFMAFAAGIVHYALFPAVAARFFIYFCGLPDSLSVLGLAIPMFPLLMAVFLTIGVAVVFFGGQITVMVTDCVQGLISYWIYAALILFVFLSFSMRQIGEAMLSRPPGQSFVNPFDLGELSEFNIFYVLIGLFMSAYGRMAWQGQQGYNCAAKNAHEQKMAGVLGTWKFGFTYICITMLLVGAFTYLTHPDFAQGAASVHAELESRINLGSETVTDTIRNQMLVPVALRHILPVGLLGLFAALMLFLMVSTDSSMLHSWGSILVQDMILPLRKKAFRPQTQILLLRLGVIAVAIFAGLFSYFYGQVTYLLMFFHLTAAVFIGGAGAVIIGGLYWKRGTTTAAWTAMITGSGLSILGFYLQHNWRESLYPRLAEQHPALLEEAESFLAGISAAVPVVHWQVTPEKFPISGAEMGFFAALAASFLYILVSWLTCREIFNLDRMLHRGQYDVKHEIIERSTTAISRWKRLLLGMDEQFSRSDRILAWSVFLWAIFNFASFLLVVAVNKTFGIWSAEVWFAYWKYYTVPLAFLVGFVTTVWFSIGGTRDLLALFRDLKTYEPNDLDDGRITGHVNADDSPFIETKNEDNEKK